MYHQETRRQITQEVSLPSSLPTSMCRDHILLLSNFLQNQNNEKDNRVTQLQNPGPGFQTENDANPEEVVSNSDILKAVVEGNLLQHQQNVAIQRVFDSLDKLNLSKPSGSVGAAAAASSTQDQDVVVTDFREIKSADDLLESSDSHSARKIKLFYVISVK